MSLGVEEALRGAGARERAATSDDLGFVEMLAASIAPRPPVEAAGLRAEQDAASAAMSFSSAGPAPTLSVDTQSSRRGSGPLPVGGGGRSDRGRFHVPPPVGRPGRDAGRLPEPVEEGGHRGQPDPAREADDVRLVSPASPSAPDSPVARLPEPSSSEHTPEEG